MSAPYRAVLFDKDGTLVDFERTWPPVYRAVAAELAAAAGEPALAGRLVRMAGYDADGALDPASPLACGTTEELVAVWSGQPELAGVPGIAERVDRAFAEASRRAPPAIDDLAGLFGRLRGRGLALGVATNDSSAAARAWLASVGVDGLLDFVSGCDSGHGVKPEAGPVLAFCAATNVTPAEVVVVGDAVHDLDMARAAGAGLAVGVLGGVTGRDRLAPRADCLIESIAGIEALLS